MRHVWIVEGLFVGSSSSWGPTIGVALTKADAKLKLADWRNRNPADKFRLRKYVCLEAYDE